MATSIADVSRAQALVSDARKALDDTVLRAPADGVVGHVNAEVGELAGGRLFAALRAGAQAAAAAGAAGTSGRRGGARAATASR